MRALINMTGKRCGHLLVIERRKKDGAKVAYWLCRCDCGRDTVVNGQHLRRGLIVSCGSHARSMRISHGHFGTRTYRCWNGMLSRCGHWGTGQKNYAERGIRVCERWFVFENFLEDMGECPSGKSIDRINNDGNYEPDNCRWATPLEQMQNVRHNRNLTHNGRTMSMSAWAREKGWHQMTIACRLSRGWSVALTLDTPLKPSRWDKKRVLT
jgi:hypothetical protein